MTLRYLIGSSGQVIEISPRVLEHFGSHVQRRAWSTEAGGQLFADIANGVIRIGVATGPRPTDFRAPFLYFPDKKAERAEIASFYQRGAHFVGDWHTHPQDIPKPSSLDLRTVRSTVERSKLQLGGVILVIVGRKQFPEGLFVSVTDLSGTYPLQPEL